MSISLGPQGYATPPNPDLYQVPVAVQALIQPPPQQPAREVTAAESGKESNTSQNDGGGKDDGKGTRRGRYVDTKA
jgi:hypothetical protein